MQRHGIMSYRSGIDLLEETKQVGAELDACPNR
jgi:hypothetical protein